MTRMGLRDRTAIDAAELEARRAAAGRDGLRA